MTTTPLIFDCDPGDDDAVALFMALAVPETLKILGITTTSGNVSQEMTYRNARSIASLAGREGIRIFKGSDKPLKKEPFYSVHIHGETGMDGYDFPESKAPHESMDAVDFLIKTLLESSEKITLAVTGPATNVARAFLQEPKIKDHIKEIVMMCGARKEKGNITPVAEFNAWVDPHALQVVLDNFTNIVMIGLDVSHNVIITEKVLEPYYAHGSEVCKAIAGIMDHSIKNDRKLWGLEGRAVHDACVTAYLLHPEYFKGKPCRVDVECESKLTIGQTVINWFDFHQQHHDPNCLYIYDVNSAAVLQLIWDTVSRYGGTTAEAVGSH